MNNKLELNLLIDLKAITAAVEASKTLEDNETIFGLLAGFAYDKKAVEAFLEAFEAVEREIKQVINDKAKSLYGTEWTAIKGHGYKLSRSYTGDVYIMSGTPPPQFVKIKRSLDTKLVNQYVKAEGKLPRGVDYSDVRGERIGIKVDAPEVATDADR